MTLTDISNIRLFSQRIAGCEFKTAKEIVSWMGAMQAQDYLMSKWAIGTRLSNSTNTTVEDAIDKGEIIRTNLMRPTWHYVSADDIYWILELTAPQIKSAMKSRHFSLELSEDMVSKSKQLVEDALSTGVNLTREELSVEFAKAKIRTNENRLSHFLMLAELEGIICSGKIKDNKVTYALLSERVPNKKLLTREESLAELAKRYFTSHGPATVKDFARWSGLSLTDARKGLDFVKSDFISETIGSDKYWVTNSFSKIKYDKNSVHLLPAYDEYLIGYRDRSPSLSLIHNKKIVSDNGIFRPVVVINGLVSGLWKRTTKKNKVALEVNLFQPQNDKVRNQILENASMYGKFLNKDIGVNFTTE